MLKENQFVVTLKVSESATPSVIAFPWAKKRRRDFFQIEVDGNSGTSSQPNPMLAQAVLRAQTWLKLLSDGSYGSIDALARAINLHPKVIRKAIRTAFLSPQEDH